jgi:L-amino acid N-acyltransferase YncA
MGNIKRGKKLGMNIRKATPADAAAIIGIYNYYVLNTPITFETAVVSLEEMQNRIREKCSQFDWIVGEIDGKVIGYSYFGKFRERPAYNGTVESTIILDRTCIGRGFGRQLYSRLIESAGGLGFHQMIAVIALPNPESTGLHAKLGFQQAGILKNVGYKFGNYIDIGLWQKSL